MVHYNSDEEELLRAMARAFNINETNLHHEPTWEILKDEFNKHVPPERMRTTGIAMMQKFKRMMHQGKATLPANNFISSTASMNMPQRLDFNLRPSRGFEPIDPALYQTHNSSPEGRQSSMTEPTDHGLGIVNETNTENQNRVPFPSELIANRGGSRV